ncbi:NADP-dependent oxidoreductase [Embleya sp. NBC_00896]|uniref:NADP-dependent oxidoreductase n=1 Tax=Embleya sp. NBC_00896 TaxID=2975961 RepID=UPI00386E13D3|nr:NADP-dependent oxidoreductase [Embleya sp. NBC_00896]
MTTNIAVNATKNTTTTMRTVHQDALGGPEVLRVIEAPRPAPGPGEVLVEVRAAGVNPIDWKIRAGGMWLTPPFTLGWDVSGVVAGVGPGVERFAVGDEVYGIPGFPQLSGGYAEYVVAAEASFAPKPATLDHVRAAALPVSASVAWQALVEAARVGSGDRVLIHAAAGGVGHLAVQIAKSRGAYVIGTASAAKHALLRELGVDEVVDYASTDFGTAVRDVDVVLDLIGGDYEDRSLATLRPGGVLVNITNPPAAEATAAKAAAAGVRGLTVDLDPTPERLALIAAAVDAGDLRPIVARTFPLAEVAKAHELGEANRTIGKIVLTP